MTFDPSAFLNTAYNEANSTEIVPVDEGEYQALAGEVTVSQWVSSKDSSKSGLRATIPWEIDNETQRVKTGRDKIIVRQDLMLDTTPNGMLDMGKGKNVGLGRLREALGLNKPGVPFQFQMITGRAAKIKVSHREYEGRIFEDVKGVASL